MSKKHGIVLFVIIAFFVFAIIQPLARHNAKEAYLKSPADVYVNKSPADGYVNGLKENEAWASLLIKQPGLEKEIKEKLDTIFSRSYSKDQMLSDASRLSSEIFKRELQPYLISASDDKVYNMLKVLSNKLNDTKDYTSLCASLARGTISEKTLESLPTKYIELVLSAQSDIIRSTDIKTNSSAALLDPDSMLRILMDAYNAKNYSLDDLEKYNSIMEITDYDACFATIKFYDVLLSLGEARASQIYKTIMYGSEIFTSQPAQVSDDAIDMFLSLNYQGTDNKVDDTEKNEKPAATIDKEQIIEKTGLLIKRFDNDGNELPISGGYIRDTHFIITHKGKEITKIDAAERVNLNNMYYLEGEKAVLVEQDVGGNLCPYDYRIISISGERASISEDFGFCSEPSVEQLSDELVFTFRKGYTDRHVVTYRQGKVSEEVIKLPLREHIGSDLQGYGYLEKYLRNNDLESVFLDKKLNTELKEMMGSKIDILEKNLLWKWYLYNSSFLMVHGTTQGSGGFNDAFLAISRDKENIYAAILSTDWIEMEAKQRLEIFSSKPAILSDIPFEMTQWINQYPNAITTWHFNE